MTAARIGASERGAPAAWIILLITDKTVGFRVDPEEEQTGLDLAEHGEPAYDVVPASVLAGAGVASNGESAAGGTADGEAAAPEAVS